MRKYFPRIPSRAWVCSSINFLDKCDKKEMVGERGILCTISTDLTEALQEGSGLVSCQPRPLTHTQASLQVLQLTKPLSTTGTLHVFPCLQSPAHPAETRHNNQYARNMCQEGHSQ